MVTIHNIYHAAIQTRHIGPTNTKGARIKAFKMGVPEVSVTIPYNHTGPEQGHDAAVQKFIHKYQWGENSHWLRADDGGKGYIYIRSELHRSMNEGK